MNIAWRLKEQAKKNPHKIAVKMPRRLRNGQYNYQSITFKELDQKSDHYASSLLKSGAKRGDRVLFFMRPSLKFHAMVFALYKARLVPVMIDPGMGRKNLLKCIQDCKPTVMVAESEVFLAKKIFSKNFEGIKLGISTGRFKFGADLSEKDLLNITQEAIDFESTPDDELAAILFTSGGTGSPKGVLYTHGIFDRQTSMLQDLFNLNPEETDLPGFPLFSLFTLAMGMTSVIPDMDPRKPAQCNPETLVKNIIDNQCTFVAGSPAIWERVANFCMTNQIKLPSVKYVVMFGAPVRHEIHEMFQSILPNGDTFTPYGATECLPVSMANGKKLLEHTKEKSLHGLGTCVGKAVPGVSVKIIKTSVETINHLHEATLLPTHEIGEIIVCGPTVTLGYDGNPEATAKSKINSAEGIYHRMGDVGYLDEDGNLWFCGRAAHIFSHENTVKYSIPTEAIFNNHPEVKRSALITYKKGNVIKPAIAIELKNIKKTSCARRDEITRELRAKASAYKHTQDIETIFYAKSFPVDVRHNIKIDRKKLGEAASNGELL
ncbi:MAG: fatty acid CoA ligase family protein [Bdellovibrio sp.]